MPNNLNQPNRGQGMQDRNKQGEFTKDKSRNASDRGNSGYGKDKNIDYQKGSNLGRQGSSSQSSKHMSNIGRKGGQH
ncbi:MAG TPA: hypothetical protein VEV84_02475 [Pyrinomonadaceae bacterium]|jgi:general stress protein YciG|nr:hypothetical protein [Pyrinomonadaceae bacterium]